MAGFPEFAGTRYEDLMAWVVEELGSLDGLESWRGGMKAVAPRMIYHVAAATLPVSLWQTLVCGLVLGAINRVKLPSGVDSSGYRRFSEALPRGLRELVVYEDGYCVERMREADVVVVLGEDDTLARIRGQLLPQQRWVGYGTKVSFLCGGLRGLSEGAAREVLERVVQDVVAYRHVGCLAPRAIFLAPGEDGDGFCVRLCEVVKGGVGTVGEQWVQRSEALLIQAFRAEALFKGVRVYPKLLLGSSLTLVVGGLRNGLWTEAPFCLPVVILKGWEELRAMKKLKGKVSTVGWIGRGTMPEVALKIWMELGATRFCKAGRMQQPSVFWKHDGYDTLRSFVRWVQRDGC
jgi:hypothetical protein